MSIRRNCILVSALIANTSLACSSGSERSEPDMVEEVSSEQPSATSTTASDATIGRLDALEASSIRLDPARRIAERPTEVIESTKAETTIRAGTSRANLEVLQRALSLRADRKGVER